MARSKARFLFAALAVVATPAALACNAIIGLDDYTKAQCDNRICDGGITDDDVVRPDAPNDQATPDVRVDAPGTNPVSWAKWRMPHYPDAAVDANEPNAMSYSPTGAKSELKDDVTGLVWMEPMNAGATGLSWAQAKDFCTKQTDAGGPWRLPSRIELVTLLDYSRSGVKADTQRLTGMQSIKYWTRSEVRPIAADPHRWAVDFDTGRVEPLSEGTGVASVRCVKGSQ